MIDNAKQAIIIITGYYSFVLSVQGVEDLVLGGRVQVSKITWKKWSYWRSLYGKTGALRLWDADNADKKTTPKRPSRDGYHHARLQN